MEPSAGEASAGFLGDLALGTIQSFTDEIAKRTFDWLSETIEGAKSGPNWRSPPFQTAGQFYDWKDGRPRLIGRCLVVARGKLGKPDEPALAADSFWSANPGLVRRLALREPPSFYFEGKITPSSGEDPRHFAVTPRAVCLYKPASNKPSGDGKYDVSVIISFTHATSMGASEGVVLGVSPFHFSGLEPGTEDVCTQGPKGPWQLFPPNSEEGFLGLVNIVAAVSETGKDSSLFQVIEREAIAIATSFGSP